jgi:hypothetical protein
MLEYLDDEIMERKSGSGIEESPIQTLVQKSKEISLKTWR